jgi:hypothetical protein
MRRQFTLSERVRLQLRAEVFSHPNFGGGWARGLFT